MINLDKIFKRDSEETPEPEANEILAVLATTGEHIAKFEDELSGLGYEVGKIRKSDDESEVVIYDQVDTSELSEEDSSHVIVKIDESLAVVLKNDPFSASEGTIFDTHAEHGYYPSIVNAVDGACSYVEDLVLKAEQSDDIAILTSKVLKDCDGYIATFLENMPMDLVQKNFQSIEESFSSSDDAEDESVEKAHGGDHDKKKKPESEVVDDDPEDEMDKSKAKKEEGEVEVEKSEEAVVEAEAEAEAPQASEEELITKISSLMEEKLLEVVSKVDESMKAVDEKITAVKSELDSVLEQNEKTALKIESVEAVAKSAADVVKGTTNAAPPASDRMPGSEEVRKSQYSGNFDTAFMRPNRF